MLAVPVEARTCAKNTLARTLRAIDRRFSSDQAGVTFECSRCLTEFPSEIAVELCELFAGPGHDPQPEEDFYEVTGTDVDLEPMLRDGLVLALPLNPLCSLDCKGYCAGCGQNLNEGACTCAPGDVDPRWAGLEAVRTKLEQ